jgi:predicted PurR-regulated permease PerM
MNKYIFTIIAIISIAVIVLFIAGVTQLNAQKAELATLQQTIKKNNDQISTLVKNNANENARIKTYLAQPTPTPVIEYHTQYVAQPTAQPQNNTNTSNASGGIPGVSAAQLSCWMITGDARGCPTQ